MAEGEVLVTYNHDLSGVIRRSDRFAFELYKSVSSSVSQLNQFDLARMKSYLSSLKAYLAWVVSQPQLDLPESHPRSYPISTEPVYPLVESDEANDLMRLISLARAELVSSQSSRQPSGIIPFDLARYLAIITKAEVFMDTYVSTVTPLDLPESSPISLMSGAGRTGV